MTIEFDPNKFDEIVRVTCDCCNTQITKNIIGKLDDHLIIGGSYNGKILDAIVCIPCMEEKMGFINIHKKDNIIGYC